MVFSSYEFLFIFLPLFLLGYAIIKPSIRNFYLSIFSFFFYYVGEAGRFWILPAYILINYLFALGIGKFKDQNKTYTRIFLGIGIFLNLLLLGYFKYIGFLTENLHNLLSQFHLENLIPILSVALPLGISFITFQGISYLIDVYRGEVQASKNIIVICAYISMFPHLVAGPIVRYKQVAEELNHDRNLSIFDFSEGARRFLVGLLKKILLADTFAVCADQIFALPNDDITFGLAWLGAIAYTLQIYFDFSGYSDMAIGLARMMGFHFPENFNYPYISKSIQEFWRRWHMTLSFWFRDYVYIPLGGNKKGSFRTYLNLGIVFLLTGFWHGAAWTFILWGIWHGTFLIIERAFRNKAFSIPTFIKHLYALLVVVFGWVIFRADTLKQIKVFFRHMCGYYGISFSGIDEYTNIILLVTLVAGFILSTPIHAYIKNISLLRFFYLSYLFMGALLVIFATMKLLSSSYSPFLYFRF